MAYLSYISQNTKDYLFQQFPSATPLWLASFGEELKALVDQWQLVLSDHEKSSRFGAIIYGESARYGKIALKIVPRFSPRLKTEIACYHELPYREMCPLYEADEGLGALLLKYVPSAAGDSRAAREAVFPRLYAQRRLFDESDAKISSLFPRYENVLNEVLSNAEAVVRSQQDPRLLPFLPSIARARATMGNFARDARCVIHGDAHEYNMLTDGTDCVLIDPLGYIAPFEFEYARYIGTEMKFDQLSDDRLMALIERLLPRGANLEKVLSAFAIDVTLRASNTFIEGNTREEICQGAEWAERAWGYAGRLSRQS